MISTQSSESPRGSYARPRAGIFLAGKAPKFSAETLELLRSRLTMAALLTLIVMSAAFIFDVAVRGLTLMYLHIGVLIIFGCGFVLLRSSRELGSVALRSMEIVLLATFNIQLLALMTATVLKLIDTGQPFLAVSERDFYTANFCMGIITYGLFIPNTWTRAMAVIIPFAVIAYVYPVVLCMLVPKVAATFKLSPVSMVFPSAFLASLIAVAGAHTMYKVRRGAFEARRLGQYVLLERIGKGGMGEVYRAEHVLLKRSCAIKLIRADSNIDEASLQRFEREVRATARLRHWNTVEVFDYGRTEDGRFYYVMELLKGTNLEKLVEVSGPLPPGRVVYLLGQACNALCEAHAAGLIHRDIKPANLFCAELGGVPDVLKLLDFGLVRDVELKDPEHPSEGIVIGSPYYMAPEQNLDAMATDPRTDIYSLGCVAFFLLTGRPPFDRPTKLTALYAHAFDEAIPPSQIHGTVPADLEKVIMRCLGKNPASRFQSAEELRTALRACKCADQWNEEYAHRWWQQAATSLAFEPVATGTVEFAGAEA